MYEKSNKNTIHYTKKKNQLHPVEITVVNCVKPQNKTLQFCIKKSTEANTPIIQPKYDEMIRQFPNYPINYI